MVIATVRDLRTRFPRIKELVAREGEVVVSDRGRRAYVLRPYVAPRRTSETKVDYLGRLMARQRRPLSPDAARALDEANRGER